MIVVGWYWEEVRGVVAFVGPVSVSCGTWWLLGDVEGVGEMG